MAWLGIAATIAWNLHQYRRGRPTICAITRRVVPRPAFVAAFPVAAAGLAVHVWRGYPPRVFTEHGERRSP